MALFRRSGRAKRNPTNHAEYHTYVLPRAFGVDLDMKT